MGFLTPQSNEFIRLRITELFTSNVPATTPSYSDTGKSATVSAVVFFLASGLEWLLVQFASVPGGGWFSVGCAVAAFVLHRLILLFQHGSESKLAAIKAEIKQIRDGDEPPDPPAPTDGQPGLTRAA